MDWRGVKGEVRGDAGERSGEADEGPRHSLDLCFDIRLVSLSGA